jgi:hypothetical protein
MGIREGVYEYSVYAMDLHYLTFMRRNLDNKKKLALV